MILTCSILVHQFTDYDRQVINEHDFKEYALEDRLVRDQLGWFYIGLAIAVVFITVYIICINLFKSMGPKIKAFFWKFINKRGKKE